MEIYTKYPNRALLEKMLHIAKLLNAQIQGEGGEVYNSIDEFPEIDFSSTTCRNELSLIDKKESFLL